MASGSGNFLIGKAVELGQRAGKWGLYGMGLLAAQQVIVCVAHFSLDNVASAIGTVGWELTLVGIFANTKRNNDLQVTVAAEAKIDRAAISTVLPGPDLAPTSKDPAVQREIDRHLEEMPDDKRPTRPVPTARP